MRWFIPFVFVFSFCTIGSLGAAAETGAQLAYQEGVRAFQEQDFEGARSNFSKAQEMDPDNIEVLYNLGLAELKLNNTGRAVAAWRKAVSLNPYHSASLSALEYLQKTAGLGDQRPSNLWGRLRMAILRWVTLDLLYAFNAALLAVAGYLLIAFWGRRRQALLAEAPLPPFPTTGVISSLLLLVALSLLAMKTYDYYMPRATVVSTAVPVRTYPSNDSNTLFEVLSGFEVIVRKSQGDWTQVTYPGGMTGWVPTTTLFHTSGRRPW